MSGYFLMHRGWQDNPIFDREEFSRRDAWAWLIEHAAWKPSRAHIKGEMIDLDRGELCFAQRFLAEKWGWSKSRVDRFLKLLAAEGMIETRTKIGATSDHAAGQGQSIISICNYERYQAPEGIERGNVEPQNGATPGQQRTKEEEGKEYTSEDKSSSVVSPARTQKADPFPCPDDVDASDWNGLKANRKAKRAPLTEAAYRQIITKLDRWKQDGWPPGPIVACAAERGWTTVFETDDMKGRNHANDRNGGHRGYHQREPRVDGFTAALRRVGNDETDYPYAGNG